MLAEIQEGISRAGVIVMDQTLLIGAISALGTAVVFLFDRLRRQGERMEKQLTEQAIAYREERDNSDREKDQLWDYVRNLEGISCPQDNCPMRKHVMPAPRFGEYKKA